MKKNYNILILSSLLMLASCESKNISSSEVKSEQESEIKSEVVSSSESEIVSSSESEEISSTLESSSSEESEESSSSIEEKSPFVIESEISEGYSIDDNGNYLISASGDYTLSGYLEGSILLANDLVEKVTLNLNNFECVSNSYPCIYWQSEEKKVVINILDETNNYLTLNNSSDYSTIESENNIEISGNGNLSINSNDSKHGIKGSEVTISSAKNLSIIATNKDGINGKTIVIEDSNVSIDANDDNIQADLNSKGKKGTIEIISSTLDLIKGNGFKASTSIIYNGNEEIKGNGDDDPAKLTIEEIIALNSAN